ncbi:MAG: hypothetical protein ACJAQS_000708 [Porticoccus sp.]|jgi:hypothetical protein
MAWMERKNMTGSVSYSIEIELPLAQAWEKLQNLSLAHNYVPGLKNTEITTDKTQGVGASRRVFQGGSSYVDETVEEWNEGQGFLIRLHKGETGKPPLFNKAWFRYAIEDNGKGGTTFTPSMTYEMPWGGFGSLLERIFLKKVFIGVLRDVAIAMKDYYETGEAVGSDRLKALKAAR